MALKFYKTESLIPGYKLGLNNDNLYISVPKKYCKKYNSIIVVCDKEKKEFVVKDKVMEVTQMDKFTGKMNYCLYYFLWKSYDN